MSVSAVQSSSKEVLGCIKGLGVKRVQSLISYRTSHPLTSLDDLLNIKGIGKRTIENIRNDTKKKVCTNFNPNEKSKKRKNIKAK